MRSGRRLLSTAAQVFDRPLKNRQREWAISIKDSSDYDYLKREVAERLVDKLDDIVRDFPKALDVGCHRGLLYDAMVEKNEFMAEGGRGIGGISHLTQADTAGFRSHVENKTNSNNFQIETSFLEYTDEEDILHLPKQEYDVVLSSLWMHWVNDIPNFLKGVRQVLKPDGVFICSAFGGNTLEEFRHSFYLAELERKGGVSPHVSPLLRASDAASLLQQAHFALPTLDVDTITVNYLNAAVLMEHLVSMGEGSAAFNRQYSVGKESFLAMAAIYQGMAFVFSEKLALFK
jgi:NADH dehydrogenase [ubiquinone] 1 alpha subcomplex assembly factor 5